MLATIDVGDLSPHFSLGEFACRGAGVPGHPPHDTVVDPHLVEHLERLRALCGGRPLVIVSGHRCEWWNRHPTVQGAKLSQHLYGRAADLKPDYATEAQARGAGFTGIGLRGRMAVHVDVRLHRATWSY